MTVIPEKKDAVFVRGVVIACGMQDDQNDKAPDKAGIKKIFTNYLQHESDVQHSYIKNFHVHQLENTITSEEITIADQKVPAGSWIASHMVINPKLKEMIQSGILNGYSLGAIGDKGLNDNQDLLNKSLMYEDLKDYEELNPLFISFVKKASNGFNWEVFDYTQFLNKSSINGDIMAEDVKSQIEDEKISLNGLERIKDIFGLNKESSEEEEPVEETSADEEMDKEGEAEAEPVDISNAELLEKLPQAVAEAVISALSDYANKEEEPAEPTEEEELEKESEEESEKEETDEEKEEESEDDNKLNKSSQKMDEMPPKKTAPKSRFLESETRDAMGRNKRYL